MIILIIITFALISIFNIPSLIRQKYWKELITFSILMLIGFGLSMLLAMGINLPSITNTISQVFKTLLKIKE